ncbi:hypothetical protein ACI2K4_11045 [Micromonospora sp. NPDC050397]|uniref:hypothetical protein n=1 Tax=Micromonospora sp. NPDC050397 TaxID=3364279 RepID=UPI00384D7C44
MSTSIRPAATGMLLLGLLTSLALAGCADTEPKAQDPPTATAAPSASATTPPSRASYTALPPCNVLPESMRGTFQGNILMIDKKPQSSDDWTEGVSCLGLLAGRTEALTTTLWLFQADSGTEPVSALARTEAGNGEPASGWGDEAWWNQNTCSLTIRYGNLVVSYAQRAPTEGCRTDVERLATAFAEQHLSR